MPTVAANNGGAAQCNETSRCLSPPRFNADVELYNAAADRVVAAANAGGAKIATADLYSYALERCGGKGYSTCAGFQKLYDVHYTAAGRASLAKEMDRSLAKLLDVRQLEQ